MRYNLFRISLIYIFLALFSFPSFSLSQQQNKGSVTGRIVNSKKEPVAFASVAIEGTTTGSTTEEDGSFRIKDILSGNQALIVTGMGIKSEKIPIQVASGAVTELGSIEVDHSVALDEVLVIGKTESRKQQEQAYAVSVLDMKKAYATTTPLNKLLDNISSIRVREDGGVGSNYNFSLNGFSGNQVKFFLDGIPMDNFGSSFNLSNMSAGMAERVEVYKGVLPVSLGADALGGAVNIISRKDANYLDVSYSIGSFNTHRASVNGAYTDMKTGFTVRANAFYNYSDNNYKVFVPIVDLQTNETLGEQWAERFHDNYRSGGVKFETGVTNKPYADYLLAGIILSENKNDVQTGATMDAVYGAVKTKSSSVIPSIRYKKDDLFFPGLSLALYGAYSDVNAFNTDTVARKYNWLGEWVPKTEKGEQYYTDSEIKNTEWLANGNISYMIDDYQSVTLNNAVSSVKRTVFDEAHPKDESNKIPQYLEKNVTGLGWQIHHKRWNATVFGKMYYMNSSTYKKIDEFTSNERLVKMEDSKTDFGYGTALTWFLLPGLQTKFSYEQAYRLPESNEIFGDGLIQQRNPDLKPENSDNVNLGAAYEQRLKEHTLFFEANFIYRNTKNFILKGINLTSNPTTGYENFGKVLTQGIEGGMKYQWKNLLHAEVNMTYQNIVDNQQYEENNDSYVGEGVTENITYKSRLPNIPYLFGYGNAGVRFQDFFMKKTELTLDYSINYVRDYYLSMPGLGAKATKEIIPEQFSHDIVLGYTLQNGKYGIVLECTNITNEKLYDNYKLQKPGRAFNLKFRYFLK